MFSIFKKSNPKLFELIPQGSTDIHSHILPGIDDGAKNIQDSIGIISQMKKIGFKKIIATPHTYPGLYENTSQSIKSSYISLKKDLKTKINIDYASEYMMDFYLIKKAKEKSLFTLKNNYVLVEMSFISAPKNLYDILFQIQVEGYIPVLAHPERYRFLFNNFKEFFRLKEVGCMFQLNLLSVVNFYGNDIVKFSDKLLENNLIDFVGSDIHNLSQLDFFKEKIRIKKIKELSQAISNNNLFED